MIYSEYFPGRTLNMNGKDMLYCSGTSYLGLSVLKEYQELVKEGVDKYGVHFSGSRNGNVQFRLFEEAEEFLKDWLGVEDALVTSSGLAAGQLLVKVLQDQGWTMEYVPGCHPALWRSTEDDVRGDFMTWSAMMKVQLDGPLPRRLVLLCNSNDPILCHPVSFEWMMDIGSQHEIILVVDDSHGIGVGGKEGEGIVSTLKRLPRHVRWVITASLGKAPALAAGFVAGDATLLGEVRNSPWFAGASPSAPAFLHALIQGEELRKQQLQKLKKFQLPFGSHSLIRAQFTFQRHLPVFFTKHQGLAPYLQSREIVISHFPYPRPESQPVSRVVLHAALEPADIGKLLDEIKTFYEAFN